MELIPFTDLVDALSKVADRLKVIVNLPKSEHETICRTMDETNWLTDTTLNMANVRLGDNLIQTSNDDLPREDVRLIHLAERATR